MKWQGLIFDRDGTIFDSLPVILNAFRHGAEPFLKKRPTDADWFEAFGPAEMDVLERFVGKQNREEAFRRFLEYYQSHISQITLFPGMFELLRKAKEAGLKLALFTGGGRESTLFCMRKAEILNYFDKLITGNDVLRPKPHPEGILMVMNELNLAPRRTLVVGDAGADVLAGKGAGAVTVLVRWSGQVPPFDLKSEPDHVFHSVRDFGEFVFEDGKESSGE